MNFHILTLFPEMVRSGLETSILKRALERRYIHMEAVNIRDYSTDRHKKVDDYPYGGGAGMLMQAEPVYQAYCSVRRQIPPDARQKVIYVTPQGQTFTQKMAEGFAECEHLTILCGHYEGIDERVLEEIVTDEVSIGDYVLTGGELAAMVIVDAVSRLIPGVLHNDSSSEIESFHSHLLEYPQYTRPQEWHGKKVPSVLMSGNLRNINAWRREQSVSRTKERRPDLYQQYEFLRKNWLILMRQKLLHTDMLDKIERGTSEILLSGENGILMRDTVSGIYYHTSTEINEQSFFNQLREQGISIDDVEMVYLHRKSLCSVWKQLLPCSKEHCYILYTYTKMEQLPVRGLCRQEGEPNETGIVIRALGPAHLDEIRAHYKLTDLGYLQERLLKKAMFGAFQEEKLVGFIGIHDDGSMGMLWVEEAFRRRKIASGLETFLANHLLQMGMTVYAHVEEDNVACKKLQDALGFYPSKTPVYLIYRT